jgi:hypothetical protein
VFASLLQNMEGTGRTLMCWRRADSRSYSCNSKVSDTLTRFLLRQWDEYLCIGAYTPRSSSGLPHHEHHQISAIQAHECLYFPAESLANKMTTRYRVECTHPNPRNCSLAEGGLTDPIAMRRCTQGVSTCNPAPHGGLSKQRRQY